MNQPRILQIGKHFYPDVGGIETVTKNISDALSATGLTADVLCMALNHEGDRREPGYQVLRSRSQAVIAGNKTFSWDYTQKIRALSPHYDVAILHVPNPLGALATLAWWRKPLIVLWHADFDHRSLELVTRPIDVAIAKRANTIVAPTSVHLAASNRAPHFLGKGEVIPFPLAPRLRRPGAPLSVLADEVIRAARGRHIVLAAGRLVSYKGFNVLVQAMEAVRQDLYCVIAGGGPLRSDLERQIAEKNIGDSVRVTGQITDDEMADLLDIARFGCLPSVTAQEMYGLTQVEMMAVGKPVISTALEGSGVPVVNKHGETGLLARPGDAEDLAKHLASIVADRALYRRLADGAARAYREEHSLPTVGERYASLIRRLARCD